MYMQQVGHDKLIWKDNALQKVIVECFSHYYLFLPLKVRSQLTQNVQKTFWFGSHLVCFVFVHKYVLGTFPKRLFPHTSRLYKGGENNVLSTLEKLRF